MLHACAKAWVYGIFGLGSSRCLVTEYYVFHAAFITCLSGIQRRETNFMKSAIYIMRWLLFVPAYIAVFLVSNLIIYWCVRNMIFWDSDLLYSITNESNFGGHWFWGIIFTLQQTYWSTHISVFISCIKIAPLPKIAYYTVLVLNLMYVGAEIVIMIEDKNLFSAVKVILSTGAALFSLLMWFSAIQNATNEELKQITSE